MAVPIVQILTLHSHDNKHDTDITPGLSLVVKAVVYECIFHLFLNSQKIE